MQDEIFTNQAEVADNLKDSAESLGLEREKHDIEKSKTPQYIPKKSCKLCWGVGFLSFFPNSEFRAKRTQKKEDFDEKYSSQRMALCKCVKVINVD